MILIIDLTQMITKLKIRSLIEFISNLALILHFFVPETIEKHFLLINLLTKIENQHSI